MAEPPLSVSNLSAQQAPPVEVGSRVRATAPHLGIERQVATLEAWRGDTLVLVADRTINCPLVSVRRLEVSRGRERSSGTGALVGLLVGGSLGAGLGFVSRAAYLACVDSNSYPDTGIMSCEYPCRSLS